MSDDAEKHDPGQAPSPGEADAAAQAPDGGNDGKPAAVLPTCEPRLLSLLVCPFTRTTLGYVAARQELVSRPERLAFPIRDGIPILVREEGRDLDDKS